MEAFKVVNGVTWYRDVPLEEGWYWMKEKDNYGDPLLVPCHVSLVGHSLPANDLGCYGYIASASGSRYILTATRLLCDGEAVRPEDEVWFGPRIDEPV